MVVLRARFTEAAGAVIFKASPKDLIRAPAKTNQSKISEQNDSLSNHVHFQTNNNGSKNESYAYSDETN
jgi:hypothetical protein